MRHEVTTLNTKRALAASLKRFMEEEPLSKITVSQIVADCGVNRKTFYYHFTDIYALLRWMLEKEAMEVVKQFDLLVDYRQAVQFVMDYVKANRHLLCCAYDSMGRDEMRRFLCADFTVIMQKAIDDTERQLGLQVDPGFKRFLAHFYADAGAGLLIDEFTDEEGHDPQQAVEYLSMILKSSLADVLTGAAGSAGA